MFWSHDFDFLNKSIVYGIVHLLYGVATLDRMMYAHGKDMQPPYFLSAINNGLHHCTTFCHFPKRKPVKWGTLVIPSWYPLFISHQYHHSGTCTGHVASIQFDLISYTFIRVCTIALLLPNFVILQKSVRGGSLVVPTWYPLFISHQYKYAYTWTGHVVEDLIGEIGPLCITPNIGLNTLFIHCTSILSGRENTSTMNKQCI